MTVELRWEQCCTVIHEGRRCTRPATELGGLCGAHWRGAQQSTRDYLTWKATWEDDGPAPDPVPISPIPTDWDIVRIAEAMLGG